jgi:hypothetical protein
MTRVVHRDVKLVRCPRLRALVVSGKIWVEDGCYVGLAGGGVVEVQLGNVGREGDLERYLADYPGPEDW